MIKLEIFFLASGAEVIFSLELKAIFFPLGEKLGETSMLGLFVNLLTALVESRVRYGMAVHRRPRQCLDSFYAEALCEPADSGISILARVPLPGVLSS